MEAEGGKRRYFVVEKREQYRGRTYGAKAGMIAQQPILYRLMLLGAEHKYQVLSDDGRVVFQLPDDDSGKMSYLVDKATFDSVELGQWVDVGVTYVPRKPGEAAFDLDVFVTGE